MSNTKYLSERQKAIEVLAALYVLGFGSYVGFVITLHVTLSDLFHTDIPAPLYWTGWSVATQEDMAFLMCMAGLVHAIGTRLNGSWRWSPVLRLMGLSAHFGVIFAIWGCTPPLSTGQYTYGWFIFALSIGVLSAWRDTSLAVRLKYGPSIARSTPEST